MVAFILRRHYTTVSLHTSGRHIHNVLAERASTSTEADNLQPTSAQPCITAGRLVLTQVSGLYTK